MCDEAAEMLLCAVCSADALPYLLAGGRALNVRKLYVRHEATNGSRRFVVLVLPFGELLLLGFSLGGVALGAIDGKPSAAAVRVLLQLLSLQHVSYAFLPDAPVGGIQHGTAGEDEAIERRREGRHDCFSACADESARCSEGR